MTHKCFACGKRAPWGYRLPGPRSKLPPGKRGYLWACEDHRDEAEERRRKATSFRGYEHETPQGQT